MVRVYLDACIVIYYVQRHPRYVDGITRALLPTGRVKPQIVVTELTRLECRVFPLQRNDAQLLAAFDAFFTTPEVRIIPIDAAVFDLATHLRAQHRLRTPDALHLAAAIRAGCNEFWTNDDRLAQAAEGRIEVVVFNPTS